MEPEKLEEFKSRGLAEAIRFTGNITSEIEKRIGQNGPVRVLEVGCGYGVALLELRLRYRDQVDLQGINMLSSHGDAEKMKAVARKSALCPETDLESLSPPEFLYFDVCTPWPVKADSFDVVFSHHAFMWIGDKIRALEEINRVMKSDGVALLDIYIRRRERSRRFPQCLEIRQNGRAISFLDYARRYPSVRIVGPAPSPIHHLYSHVKRRAQRAWRWVNRPMGRRVRVTERIDPHLEMSKIENLDFGLEFISAEPFSRYGLKRKGCCSVYRIRE